MKLLLLVTLMLALATSHRIRTRHNDDTKNGIQDLEKAEWYENKLMET